MKCTFCQVRNCKTCRISPFYGLDLDDSPFSELTPEATPPEERIEMTKYLSISGVQRKYSLAFQAESGKLIMVQSNGQYILKPGIPPSLDLTNTSFTPENEHLSMRLTDRMGIKTALSCVIPLGGADMGYVTKRFDYISNDVKLQQEDFAQIMGVNASGNVKYDHTVEDMGRALDNLLPAALVLKAELFKRVAANFLLCNGDAHVKNYSLMQAETGNNTYVFTPAYDVLNTVVHVRGEQDTALDLTNDARDQKTGLNRESFDTLAARMGITARAKDNIINSLLRNLEGFDILLYKEWVGMDEQIRTMYLDSVFDRINRLKE